jgi:hypothetical protein
VPEAHWTGLGASYPAYRFTDAIGGNGSVELRSGANFFSPFLYAHSYYRNAFLIREVDYDIAKKEVRRYFLERSEAYPSDIGEDLELDYKLICQIVEELKKEGRLEVL